MSDFNLEDLFKPREPEPRDPFAELPDVGPIFTAQFNSRCSNCGKTLEIGQQARFQGNDAVHLKCPEQRKACPVCWLVHGTHQEECE